MGIDKTSCIRCKHYYVTWDNAFPRGCLLFGFKSKKLPSVLVKQSTGADCKNFEEKIRNQH